LKKAKDLLNAHDLLQGEAMTTISRRSFMEMAIALGAATAWGQPFATRSNISWHERRDFYPEGVASGDPESDSVLLWTRRPPKDNSIVDKLHVEVAEDEFFNRVVATAEAPISAASDWTCRVLAGRLKPARIYWYRFTDASSYGSRVGRTITAPTDDDSRPVRFALRLLPERRPGGAERISANDLRG
jgi:alkaline phosphatase D